MSGYKTIDQIIAEMQQRYNVTSVWRDGYDTMVQYTFNGTKSIQGYTGIECAIPTMYLIQK